MSSVNDWAAPNPVTTNRSGLIGKGVDRYEGPHTYGRREIDLPDGRRAWIYLELVHRPGPPAPEYVERLRRGYADFGFDPAPLEAALAGG